MDMEKTIDGSKMASDGLMNIFGFYRVETKRYYEHLDNEDLINACMAKDSLIEKLKNERAVLRQDADELRLEVEAMCLANDVLSNKNERLKGTITTLEDTITDIGLYYEGFSDSDEPEDPKWTVTRDR